MVGVMVRVAVLEPPGDTFTTLGEKEVAMPGGILSMLRATSAPAPREFILMVVVLPSGGIGGSQSGSALKVKATSEAVTWKGFMINTGGSPAFCASTSTSYQPEPMLPPQIVLGMLKTRVKSPLPSAAVLAGTGNSIPAKRSRVTLASAGKSVAVIVTLLPACPILGFNTISGK